MKIIDCEQGSNAWFDARCGKATASRVAEVVAKTKTGWGASRANYAAELIAERLTGVAADKFTNGAMQWGTDHEPEARAAYELRTETWVTTVGFVLHPTIDEAGASPDGLVGSDGMVEIKCPNVATHIETLLSRAVPGRYITQMQFQMRCAERAWCDYVSYDPRLTESMRLFIKRVERDDAMIASLDGEVRIFLDELDSKLLTLREMYNAA